MEENELVDCVWKKIKKGIFERNGEEKGKFVGT